MHHRVNASGRASAAVAAAAAVLANKDAAAGRQSVVHSQLFRGEFLQEPSVVSSQNGPQTLHISTVFSAGPHTLRSITELHLYKSFTVFNFIPTAFYVVFAINVCFVFHCDVMY